MTEATMDASKTKAPWHLWVVGLVGLLWNGFGAYDYVCSNLQGDEYFRQMGMTEPQIAYYHAMPAWMTAVWAIGVWGSVAATVLLLLRMKWALHVFVLSLAGFLMSVIYANFLSNGGELMGQMALIMNAIILVGLLLFIWYSWAMTKRGVLR